MRAFKFILFILIILVFITGCLNDFPGQKITVQKHTNSGVFEDYKEIKKKKKVKKAISIVDNANWGKQLEEIDRDADYQFQIKSKYNDEDKIASYSLWICKNKETLNLLTDTGNYAELTKEDSTILYEILVEDK